MQTGTKLNWADEMDAVDAVSGTRQEVVTPELNQQQRSTVGTMKMKDQIPWDVLFLGGVPQGFTKQQVRDAFHDLQVLNVLELVCANATLFGYYIEFGSLEDFQAAYESTKTRVLHRVTAEKVPYNYYVEYRQQLQKTQQRQQASENSAQGKVIHPQQQQQKQQQQQQQTDTNTGEQSNPSANVKQKSNPFGSAKPVDTASKLWEIENRARKEMLTKENVEAAAAKAAVAKAQAAIGSLTPRSSPYPTREQWNEQVTQAQLAAAQAIDGRPLTSPGRVTPPVNGHLVAPDEFDDRASHYSYNSSHSYSSRGGGYRSRGGRGRYGRGGRPMRSGVFDGGPTPPRQSYSRPESRNSNFAEPRYNRDDDVLSQTSHMSGRSNYSRNGDIAIISRASASRSERPPLPISSSGSVGGRTSTRGSGGRFSSSRGGRSSRADDSDRWRRD